jgi:hypothetical protein
MGLKQVSDQTLAALEAAFPSYSFSEEQKRALSEVIEAALVDTVDEAAKAHRQATMQCCGPEADMAHKITEESKRQTDLLISNLMNLR